MTFRLDKLTQGGLIRDQQSHAVIAPLWERYLFRAEEHREREIYDPQLLHYRWMIEELRVSLFAQPLGTGITVSEKRLEEQWQKVRA
jgi:ATP-dependent helicase HrpA